MPKTTSHLVFLLIFLQLSASVFAEPYANPEDHGERVTLADIVERYLRPNVGHSYPHERYSYSSRPYTNYYSGLDDHNIRNMRQERYFPGVYNAEYIANNLLPAFHQGSNAHSHIGLPNRPKHIINGLSNLRNLPPWEE